MTKTSHHDLHSQALAALADLERIIVALKAAGPHPLEGLKALQDVEDRLYALGMRFGE